LTDFHHSFTVEFIDKQWAEIPPTLKSVAETKDVTDHVLHVTWYYIRSSNSSSRLAAAIDFVGDNYAAMHKQANRYL